MSSFAYDFDANQNITNDIQSNSHRLASTNGARSGYARKKNIKNLNDR